MRVTLRPDVRKVLKHAAGIEEKSPTELANEVIAVACDLIVSDAIHRAKREKKKAKSAP